MNAGSFKSKLLAGLVLVIMLFGLAACSPSDRDYTEPSAPDPYGAVVLAV
jgi:hypothetical protein